METKEIDKLEKETLEENLYTTLVAKVRFHLKEKELSQVKFAKMINLPDTTLGKWLRDDISLSINRKGEVTSIIENYFEKMEYRKKTLRRGDIEFVDTTISMQIENALNGIRGKRTLGMIHGDAGVGKTRTLKEWAYKKDDCIVITVDPIDSRLRDFLFILCEKLKLKPVGTIGAMRREIKKKLDETDMMIIIDEAQHLPLKTLEVLRSLHDATEVAICLMGNDGIYTKMFGRQSADLAQFFSRVGIKIQVKTEQFKGEDIDNVLDEEDEEVKEYLLAVAKTPHSFRGMLELYTNVKNTGGMTITKLKAHSRLAGINV